jgi:hypothetical protein
MGQATIYQAEQTLASLNGLSDDQRRQYQHEIEEAKGAATHMANDEAERITADVRQRRAELLEEACEVRDGLAKATTATELNNFRRRQQQLAKAIEELDATTQTVEAIETDPVAYAENLFAKYPRTRPHFSFF